MNDIWFEFGDIDPEMPEVVETSKITLEYTEEEHKAITDKLSELKGSKEKIIFGLVMACRS